MPQAPTLPEGHTPITSWDEAIQAVAKQYGVSPALALAVAKRESSLDPTARGDGNLPGGSVGLFQLRPAAASDMGVNREDPLENIVGGVKYLKTLADRYRDANGQSDVQKILMAYNGGADNVDKGTVSPAAQAYAAEVIASLSQGIRTGGQSPPPATVPAAPTGTGQPAAAMKPVASHEAPVEHPHARVGRLANEYVFKPLASVVGMGPEQALPAAGAMLGGARGAMMGAPAGPPGIAVGAVAGAAIGGGGGELVQMGLERLGSWFGLTSSSPTPTVPEAVERLGSATQTAMMGEVLGQAGAKVLTKVAEKVAAPMRSRLSVYAREALAEFPPESKAILPSEVSESRMLNIVENMSEGSILGGSSVTAVKSNRQRLATSRVLDALEQIAPATTPKEAGVGVQAARAQALRQFRTDETTAWNAFNKAASDLPVSTPQLDAFVAQLEGKEATAILPNAGAEAARRVARITAEDEAVTKLLEGEYATISDTAKSLVRAQMETKEPLTAVQFQRTISDLGKLVRALEKSAQRDPSKYNAQLGAAKKLTALAREDLRASLGANPAALEAYETATEVSRLGNQRLFNQSVRDVVKAAPEQVADKIIKPNNSSAIQFVREAVGDDAMRPIQRYALDGIVQADPRTGQLDWGKIANRLQSLGDDTLNALFPEGHAQEIARLSRLMLNLQRQPAGAIGKVGIFLTQWGPFVGAMSGTLPPTAGITLGAPWVMSKIMASPGGVRWLTTGLRAPLGSEQAIRAAAHLTAFMKRELPQPVASHSQEPSQ